MLGIENLQAKLALRRERCELRYSYYEQKFYPQEIRPGDFSRLIYFTPSLGWCSRAVDALADRLVFKGWDNDDFDLQQIFEMNNPDVFFDNAILSALVTSCSFVYISADETGFPRLEIIDGRDATGVIDPVTGMLEEGYAILKKDANGQPILEAYFLPGITVYYAAGSEPQAITNKAPYPLLVPIVYRPDSKRPFGHSRISRAMMEISNCAMRTLKRSELTSEFYSYPQKYILGTSQEAEPLDKQKATWSSFLEFTKDEDGDKPTIGQFQQANISPYTEAFKTLASLFAGESGLTVDDLGFVSDNPSSAEAIKASHETLKTMAKKAQRTFGSCFLNVGYLAACVRDNFTWARAALYKTRPIWEPIFEPDAATLSGIGDGAIKINQAVPGFFDEKVLEILTGIQPGAAFDE